MSEESREYLSFFVKKMEEVMDKHDQEKGCMWKISSNEELTENLFEEIREFEIKNDPDYELIDIACSAYILWAARTLHKKGFIE